MRFVGEVERVVGLPVALLGALGLMVCLCCSLLALCLRLLGEAVCLAGPSPAMSLLNCGPDVGGGCGLAICLSVMI